MKLKILLYLHNCQSSCLSFCTIQGEKWNRQNIGILAVAAMLPCRVGWLNSVHITQDCYYFCLTWLDNNLGNYHMRWGHPLIKFWCFIAILSNQSFAPAQRQQTGGFPQGGVNTGSIQAYDWLCQVTRCSASHPVKLAPDLYCQLHDKCMEVLIWWTYLHFLCLWQVKVGLAVHSCHSFVIYRKLVYWTLDM